MSFEPAVISAITALVAIIIGPLVSICIAKNQINASVISTNRQVWINRLRDELATLVGMIHHWPSAHANDSISTNDAIAEYGKFVERFQVIKLLINPNEADHQELVRLIECADEKLIESINNKISNRSKFETIGRDIVTQSQIVLKKEWQRVKSGQ